MMARPNREYFLLMRFDIPCAPYFVSLSGGAGSAGNGGGSAGLYSHSSHDFSLAISSSLTTSQKVVFSRHAPKSREKSSFFPHFSVDFSSPSC
jgi:hypothetical protein